MSTSTSQQSSLRRPRVSGCALRSLQKDDERLRSKSVRERILAALSMRQRFARLNPAVIK